MLIFRAMVATALAVACAPAAAEAVWVGGAGSADTTHVAYLGRIAPLPGQSLGDGWGYATFLDYVGYEYAQGSGPIEARARGLRVGLQRQHALADGTLGYGLGALARHTRLSPDDPGNRNRGNQLRAVAELQWRSSDTSTWRGGFYSQYVFGARSDYAKLFLGRRVGERVAIGPQLWSGGDPDYRVYGMAVAVDGWRLGPARMSAYAGAERQEGGSTQPALGIEFSLYRGD